MWLSIRALLRRRIVLALDLTIYFHLIITKNPYQREIYHIDDKMIRLVVNLFDNNQIMSSQKQIDGRQEVEMPIKKLKKGAQDENLDSGKKLNKPKPDFESQKNKITSYLSKPLNIEKYFVQKKPEDNKHTKSRLEQLEEQLKQKDKTIVELKNRKQDELQRANNLFFEAKDFKKKTKKVIANSFLELAELKRIERHRKNEKLGSFTENMRTFIEGEYIVSLKNSIQEKQQRIFQLNKLKTSKSISNEQMVRTISSIEFTNRELNEMRKELNFREKEVAVYKDRMKLAEKQVRSMFYKQGWPLVYDRYQTLQLLGAGGFGEVYKCFDLETNRMVALKIVTNKEAGSSPEDIEDFFRRIQRQADIQKQLSHPNITAFHNIVEVNKDEGKMVFELEYCDGIQLSVYLRKYQCLQEKQAKLIIRQLFGAICYLSKLKQRVIHYDLKPSNIMFCQGIVKILDFGLCKVMNNSEESRMMLTSQGVGTYWYLPPETFQEYDPKISCKVDVWSLGVIFFQLLYGRKPFAAGISQSEIYEKSLILKAYQPVFPKDNPKKYSISKHAIQFITLCLKYNPNERPTPEEAYNHDYLKKE